MSSISDTSSIKQLALKGAAWTIIGYGASQILRFCSNLVLTRLLFPEVFGLMNLVIVFITGLHLFSDLGINASVIQNERGDEPEFLNTAWTLQVGRGILLWLCCFLIAYPAAQFYKEPRFLWLIPIVGLNTLISGFNSTYLFTLNRHLSVKTLALYELSGQVVGIAVMLLWAWISPSIWALIASGLISSIFQLCLSHWINRGVTNRFAWDKNALKELISFGKWLFLSTAIYFLSAQSDRLILGKLFPLQMLGVYSIAFALSDIPRQVVFAVTTKVVYPVYARLVELPRVEFRAKVVAHRQLMLLISAVGLGLLVGLGDLVIKLLYDNRYSAAGWMFPLLALGVWPLVLIQTIDRALWAIGKPQYWTFGSFLSFLVYIFGIPLGAHSPLHEVGAVLAVAVSNVPIWLVILYGLWREKLLAIRQDFLMTALMFLVLALVSIIRMSLGFGLPFDGLSAALK